MRVSPRSHSRRRRPLRSARSPGCPERDTRRMDVAVVGSGRVGTAMAVLLQRAGHQVLAVAGSEATRERAAAYLPGVPVLSNEDAARGAGASAISVHPLQTCPDVGAAIDRIPGSAFAVSAYEEPAYLLGERLALDVGGRPFRLDDGMKALYPAAAVFASNYLVAVTALAERMERTAGVPDPLAALRPLQRATLDNVEAMGAADALTGPAVRGDAATVERNLRALSEHAPEAIAAYISLADVALELAADRIEAVGRTSVEEVLARWR